MAANENPAVALRRICHGMRAAQALHVAARLAIADRLASGPATGAELAAFAGCEPAALRRLMRALCALGVFAEPEADRFALTPLSERLRSDAPASFRWGADFLVGEARWRCWSDLLGSVRTGEARPPGVLGASLFDWYAAHPDESDVHDKAMAAFTAAMADALVEACGFSRFRTIVDVGGGSGQLLATILDACPAAEGVLFDLPHVVAGAEALLAARGVADRCRIVGGDFFASAPADGDLSLLKHVVHDWDDKRALTILRTCRKAARPDSRLQLLECALPEHTAEGAALEAYLLDLEMLLMTPGGRERTTAEFAALLSAAGFELVGVTPTRSLLSVIEARPA